MSVRGLRRDELAIAADTLALAFEDDPFFRHVLPEATSRARWLRWFHLRALRECHDAGGAFTVDGGPEHGVVGTHPPGTWPPPFRSQLRSVPFPPGLPPHRLVTVGLAVERQMHRDHVRAPHVYVCVLGVHPARKGTGLGGALLRHVKGMAREQGVVAHLETSNPVNLPLYRHYGFDVKTEIVVGDAPPVWTMTTEKDA